MNYRLVIVQPAEIDVEEILIVRLVPRHERQPMANSELSTMRLP